MLHVAAFKIKKNTYKPHQELRRGVHCKHELSIQGILWKLCIYFKRDSTILSSILASSAYVFFTFAMAQWQRMKVSVRQALVDEKEQFFLHMIRIFEYKERKKIMEFANNIKNSFQQFCYSPINRSKLSGLTIWISSEWPNMKREKEKKMLRKYQLFHGTTEKIERILFHFKITWNWQVDGKWIEFFVQKWRYGCFIFLSTKY